MGIKTSAFEPVHRPISPLKNLPTTWGLRPGCSSDNFKLFTSEKPPHHMGIKTNLPYVYQQLVRNSEKPPHHMGIKTRFSPVLPKPCQL